MAHIAARRPPGWPPGRFGGGQPKAGAGPSGPRVGLIEAVAIASNPDEAAEFRQAFKEKDSSPLMRALEQLLSPEPRPTAGVGSAQRAFSTHQDAKPRPSGGSARKARQAGGGQRAPTSPSPRQMEVRVGTLASNSAALQQQPSPRMQPNVAVPVSLTALGARQPVGRPSRSAKLLQPTASSQ